MNTKIDIKELIKHEFTFAALAVDAVVFTVKDGKLQVLLIKNTREPFKNLWALPGGLVRKDETLEQAHERVLENKVHLHKTYCEQIYTFGALDRDPRSRVVSVAYLTLLPPTEADTYTNQFISWMPIEELSTLAYDHHEIIKVAAERLRSKLEYTNIVYSLVPEEFTLGELQGVYETILHKELDKRNFRRKLLSLGLIKQLSKKRRGEPNRPAQLFSFKQKTPQVVEVL